MFISKRKVQKMRRNYRQFWDELDSCASRYDVRVEHGLETEPLFLISYRRGKYPLWIAFWCFSFFPMMLLAVICYYSLYIWYPLQAILLYFLFAYGLIAGDALRYTASRYEGLLIWKRLTQCLAMLLLVVCGFGVMGYSASAAGY